MKNSTTVNSEIEMLTSAIQEIANGNLNLTLEDQPDPRLQPMVRALREMTERLKREFQNAQSIGASLRNLVETIPVAVLKWSGRGDILLVNRSALALWGFSDRGELVSRRRIQDLFVRAEDLRHLMHSAAENGAISDFELTLQRRDGEQRLVSCTAAVLRDEYDKVNGFAATFREIADQREMETHLIQMEKLESIGEFAAGLAHDLNNILCGILPIVEILRRRMTQNTQASDSKEKELNLLDSIDKSAQCGVTLAKQLMSFSRKSQSNITVTNLNTVVMECLHQLKQSLTDIKIETDLASDLWNVEADRGQVEEILIHLGKNAQRAMKGNGVLRVSTQNCTLPADFCVRFRGVEPGSYVQMTVSDTGCGIPSENLHRTFDPFFDVYGMGQGMGLALSMVYGMVKNHNGCIDVESEVNHGTTFRIYLPQTKKAQVFDTPSRPSTSRLSERILVVDDETLVREATAELLSELGYEVSAVQDGDEALMRINQREQYDLVILDMQMPRLDGQETLSRLREASPYLKVILTSGHCPSENVQDLLQRYRCVFLQKPYRLADISKVVRNTLNGVRLTEENPA